MKKLIALLLVLALSSSMTLSALAENDPSGDPPPDSCFGTLSMLNMTEEEFLALISARRLIADHLGVVGPREGKPPEGEPPEGQPPKTTITFYDTLDGLLMALNAGEIQNIEIYQSVARYLCATNENLMMDFSIDADKVSETFAELVQNGINGNDFSFLMMESNAALRDEFNAAISAMKADGTLADFNTAVLADLITQNESTNLQRGPKCQKTVQEVSKYRAS